MKRTMIYRYLKKSNNIALDMYLIALFCDEPCGFAMYCIQNKHYNIRGILKSGMGNTNCCLWDYNCIHKPIQSCTKMCLQLIGSHSVASVNACLCLVTEQNDYLWPIKNSSTYEIYLDKSIEACIGNCSPPPPKPKHYRVLHLTPLSPPPPAENTKCPCDKIKAL